MKQEHPGACGVLISIAAVLVSGGLQPLPRLYVLSKRVVAVDLATKET
jgi:hypothetical protein